MSLHDILVPRGPEGPGAGIDYILGNRRPAHINLIETVVDVLICVDFEEVIGHLSQPRSFFFPLYFSPASITMVIQESSLREADPPTQKEFMPGVTLHHQSITYLLEE